MGGTQQAGCLAGDNEQRHLIQMPSHFTLLLEALHKSALLKEVERRARERDCCRITLEVHDTNVGAKRLYEASGFGRWDSPTWFVTKPL